MINRRERGSEREREERTGRGKRKRREAASRNRRRRKETSKDWRRRIEIDVFQSLFSRISDSIIGYDRPSVGTLSLNARGD